jgi:hypothetical protein
MDSGYSITDITYSNIDMSKLIVSSNKEHDHVDESVI